MATIKKAKAGIRIKKADNGTSQAGVGPSSDEKERQFGKAPAKSQAGVGPSSNEKERQGDKSTSTKAPPNSFRSEAAEAAAKSSAPKKTRGQEYAAARKRGDKTFDYEGKKYTTESAEEKATRVGKPVASKSSAPTSKSKTEAIPEKGNESKRKVLPEVEVIAKKKTNLLPEVEVIGKKSTPKPPAKVTDAEKAAIRKKVDNSSAGYKPKTKSKMDYTSGVNRPYRNGGKMKKKC